MDSVSQQIKLPLIDFRTDELIPETPRWAAVRAQVRQALEEFGCFEAHFDGVPMDLCNSILGMQEELFDLPPETKVRNVSAKPFHGYLGPYPGMPLFESLGFDQPEVLEKVEEHIKSLWPQGYPDFSKTIQAYSEKLSALDRIIRRMILESLGLQKHLEEHLNSSTYLLRVMKYKGVLHTPERKVGSREHSDKNILTILRQNQVEWLEIQTKDGEWIGVNFSSNSFVIMSGDSLYAWTNGLVHSPNHRVMMSGSKDRYSLGLFSSPKAGYIVKVPYELVDGEHPLLFKPFDYVDFLSWLFTKGRRNESPIQTYCGV